MSDAGYVLGWDDQIEYEERGFITLPEGDYDFTIVNFERSRYTPGPNANLPACPMAIVHVRIDAEQGTVTIKHNLYLHSRTQGFLSEFFVSIGQMQKGEKAVMNWNAIVGSTGRARVGIHEYKSSKDGEMRTINEIKWFHEPDAAAPSYQAGSF